MNGGGKVYDGNECCMDLQSYSLAITTYRDTV